MQKIFTRREIETFERQLIEAREDWQDSSELIAHKSIALCNRLRQDYYTSHRAVVFAGPNEKGALAIKIGHALVGMQYDVHVVLLNPMGKLTEDVERERDTFLEESDKLYEVTTNAFNPPEIRDNDLLIDGIQGVETIVSLNNVIKYLNSVKAIKIAIEIPSGMSEEENEIEDYTKIFKADTTYTFYSPKLPFLLKEYAPYVGRWRVIYPSFYTPSGCNEDTPYALFDTQEMEQVLRRRTRFSNKYDFGKDLLIAGSEGMMGAAILSGRGAMASGAGHLTLHVPKGKAPIIHCTLPEALVHEDLSEESFSGTDLRLSEYDAIAIGPGLGRSTESYLALEQLLTACHQPLILDADALSLMSQDDCRLLELLPKGSIITPHIGEFDRLFGPSKNSRERLEKAREESMNRSIYILLKGPFTATIIPTGRVIFNTSGNPGLATSGSGDVLTGIILSLRGKKHNQQEACTAAAFLHGFAAENYATEYCEATLTASLLIEYLPTAFKRFTTDNPNLFA